MKTITEYRPMIFSALVAEAEKRTTQRRRLLVDAALVVGYGIFGIGLMADTGFTPWDGPFWMVFGPLFIAGELGVHALWCR